MSTRIRNCQICGFTQATEVYSAERPNRRTPDDQRRGNEIALCVVCKAVAVTLQQAHDAGVHTRLIAKAFDAAVRRVARGLVRNDSEAGASPLGLRSPFTSSMTVKRPPVKEDQDQ